MKDDTSTPTTDGTSPNEFERDKPGTNARSDAEAAIEELRQRGGVFVNAVRATRMPMLLTDPNLPGNPIVFANESFLKLSGYGMEEVLGQQPHFMDGPGTDPRDAARFAEILRSDQDDIIETVQYRKDGSRFVAIVLLSAYKDDAGKVLNHFMPWLDVTRRVEAEERLSDSRAAVEATSKELTNTQMLRDLSERLVSEDNIQTIYEEILSVAIEIAEAKAGTVQMLDPATDELVILATRGFSRETMDYFHRLDAGSNTSCGRALRSGRRTYFNFDPASQDKSARLHVADGILSAQSTPLVSRSGKPLGMVSTHWGSPDHRLSDRQLRFLDLLARQTADLLERRSIVQALGESEAKYRTLFESIDEGFCIIKVLFDERGEASDYRFLEANPAFERQTGLVGAVGKSMRELAPDHEEHWFVRYGRIAKTGKAERFEGKAAALGRWYDVFAFRVGEPDEGQVAVLFNDIAERKQAETALRQSEAALQASERRRDSALLAAEMGTWDYDLVADVCHFDARAQEMYNLPSNQLDHRPEGVGLVVHPDDVGPMFDEIQRATDVNGDGRYDMVYRIARGDGTYRWLRAVGIAEFKGSGHDRRAVRIVGASRDITIEREAEEALRESERLRGAMLDVLPLGLAMTDREGNAVLINAEWEKFVPTGRIPSRDPERLSRWRTWDKDGQPVDPSDFPGARALRGERVHPPMEFLFTDDDGRELWTSVGAVPVSDAQGETVGAVCFIQNIDKAKRAAEAVRESEHHANILLAELQHRVRNSLAVVRSIARRTAENSTDVDDMLAHFQGRLDAFSRVQAALSRNPDARVDIATLVEDELIAHAARDGRQVRIKGPSVMLEAKTAERLSLALHELATNAVKHGALMNGEGKVAVMWECKRANGSEQLTLRWSESGVEIDPDAERREGFGMELLQRSLPYDLDAETAVQLRPKGLTFELRMKLPKS